MTANWRHAALWLLAGGAVLAASRMAGRMSIDLVNVNGCMCHQGTLFTGVQTELDGRNQGSEFEYNRGIRTRQSLVLDGKKVREEIYGEEGTLNRSVEFQANGQPREESRLKRGEWRRRTWDAQGRENTPPPKPVSPAAVKADVGFVWKPDPTRLVVAAVRPSSPAAEGKFEAGDVILAVEQVPIGTRVGWELEMGKFAAGAVLKISIERRRETQGLKLKLPVQASGVGGQPLFQIKSSGNRDVAELIDGSWNILKKVDDALHRLGLTDGEIGDLVMENVADLRFAPQAFNGIPLKMGLAGSRQGDGAIRIDGWYYRSPKLDPQPNVTEQEAMTKVARMDPGAVWDQEPRLHWKDPQARDHTFELFAIKEGVALAPVWEEAINPTPERKGRMAVYSLYRVNARTGEVMKNTRTQLQTTGQAEQGRRDR